MKKIYVVKVGKIPGIYESWTDCEAQVKGFKGAQYKSFTNRKEAEEYLNEGKQQEGLTKETKENVKWDLVGIREALKERDIMTILDKVDSIADSLGIELEEESLNDYILVEEGIE